MEAISDHHLWFWHLSFEYSGTLNDLNILDLSQFFESIVNEKFAAAKSDAGVVPFYIGDHEFQKLFLFVNEIYAKYSRLVCALKELVTNVENSFNRWKEYFMKYVEIAFGFLQGKFQYMARPIHTM